MEGGGTGRMVRKHMTLGVEACEMLAIHAVRTRQTESEIVGRLIDEHLNLYEVRDTREGPAPGGESSAEGPGQGRGAGGGKKRPA